MPQTILLVEDKQLEHELLSELLTEDDVRVVAVRRGQAALDLLVGKAISSLPLEDISVVLLDLDLPDLQDIVVLRELRREAAERSIPLVILSQSQKDTQAWAGFRMGADAYLTKPDSGDQLTALIARTVAFWTQLNVRVRVPPPPSNVRV